jgi:glycosyltransferase involved in cell wall biosynthesis
MPMTILVFVPYYLPGYRSGGPARSIANLVAHLGADLQFVVVTSDRDAGDAVPYAGIVPGQRTRVGRADVIYLDAAGRRPGRIAALIRAVRPDALYLNSFFSPAFSITVMLLRRFGRIPRLPVVLAPRGEFSAGAVKIKAAKKHAWLAAARLLGIYDDVLWQASSPLEAADIRRCVGAVERDGRSQIIVAPVIAASAPSAAPNDEPASTGALGKAAGRLRVVFLSRVSPKKNLLGALQILGRVRGELEFNIFGPVGDEKYWRRCRALMESLPANVRVAYRGAVPSAEVPTVMAQHDLFFLPTFGENYGHVIREALAAGTPVLVSDQTPWRDLRAAGVGWDLPLDRPDAFRDVLDSCIATDPATFASWSDRATRYACRQATDDDAIDASRRLFRAAMKGAAVADVGDGERINAW